ncbi:MAG TPA: 4a-hydroxytetrahydrobiopterin dehydratase, partial [Acidobacteriaceae bacterium]
VYSHQEHYNGSGYPRGLRGEEIPLGARIFAVADALDAITSDRPYRSATSFATARKEIRKNLGTQFDPQVVDVFLSMPDRIWEDLRAEIQGEAQKFNPFSLGAVKQLLPRKDTRAKNGILKSMPETKKSAALDADALKASVAKLPGWRVEQGTLTRTFTFPNFVEALAFVQSLGVEAEQKQHHPDLDIRYSKVKVGLVTHDAGGITLKDLALAQTADSLATPLNGK